MKTLSKKIRNCALISLVFSLIGCGTISHFDQTAYYQVVALKTETLNIMDLAKDNYSVHEMEVKTFQTKIQKAYEYEKSRSKNKITVKQWDLLLNKDGNALGSFFRIWESNEKCSETYINEKKKLIGQCFDQIIELEIKKQKNNL
ncbi:MAG: hypothetical protein LKI53_06670 [Bacteroidales bacterium]|jgi:hypothetical protein|nr:hypothetical protein [Bacteroidales bacterium]